MGPPTVERFLGGSQNQKKEPTDQVEKIWADVNHIKPLDIDGSECQGDLFGCNESEVIAHKLLLLCQNDNNWTFSKQQLKERCDLTNDISLHQWFGEFLNTWTEESSKEESSTELRRPKPSFVLKYYDRCKVGPINGIEKVHLNNSELIFCQLSDDSLEEREGLTDDIVEFLINTHRYVKEKHTYDAAYLEGKVLVSKHNRAEGEEGRHFMRYFENLVGRLKKSRIDMEGFSDKEVDMFRRFEKISIGGQVVLLPGNGERVFVCYDSFEPDIEEISKYFCACVVIGSSMIEIRTKKKNISLANARQGNGWQLYSEKFPDER